MRIIALDVGERRIGVALSDPTGTLATPLATIEQPSDDIRPTLDEIVRLVQENEASEIVVGIPVLLSGREGSQARTTRDFVRRLAERTAVPIRRVDERLSSVQAERMLRDSGAKPSREKGRIDAAAAAIILQSYLDSARRPST